VLGLLVGLAAEARIAHSFGLPAEAGGGTEHGATLAAARLIARGVTGIVSFGLAGGLDPALLPGALIVPTLVRHGRATWASDPALCTQLGGATGHSLIGGGALATTAAAKLALHQATGAAAIDLETAAAARTGLPFAALRAICDPATRDLPHAALVALDAHGRIGALRVAFAALAHLSETGNLLALARDAAHARRALASRVRTIGRLKSNVTLRA